MIIQGTALSLPISISDEAGNLLDITLVEQVEFCVGNLRKLYKSTGDGEVTYDSETKSFNFPLTEAETLDMSTTIQYQFRVKFAGSNLILASVPESIEVITSMGAVKAMTVD